MEPPSNGPVPPKGTDFYPGEEPMENKRERAHDIAEEGLDKVVEGDTETGKKLIDKVKQIDPKGIEELAEEVERDKENAERFVNKG
jgi:predicted transcriptional regulator